MFMAEEFPKSSFVGIDIVFGLKNFKKEIPTNMAIIEHNIFNGLPFPDNTFDFIDQWSFVIS